MASSSNWVGGNAQSNCSTGKNYLSLWSEGDEVFMLMEEQILKWIKEYEERSVWASTWNWELNPNEDWRLLMFTKALEDITEIWR